MAPYRVASAGRGSLREGGQLAQSPQGACRDSGGTGKGAGAPQMARREVTSTTGDSARDNNYVNYTYATPEAAALRGLNA